MHARKCVVRGAAQIEQSFAVEIRNPAFNQSLELCEILNQYNIANVITDTAGKRDVVHTSVSNDTAYIRFAGNGLTKSINNVFVKSLGDLEPSERPIHCSDKQKKVFYVKENDEWAKDENNIQIDKTIHNIHMGHLDALAEWDKQHPNWMNDEYLMKERERYSAVWGPIDEKDEKNEKDLIKEYLSEKVDVVDIM